MTIGKNLSTRSRSNTILNRLNRTTVTQEEDFEDTCTA